MAAELLQTDHSLNTNIERERERFERSLDSKPLRLLILQQRCLDELVTEAKSLKRRLKELEGRIKIERKVLKKLTIRCSSP